MAVVMEKNTFLGLVPLEEVLETECVIPGMGAVSPVAARRSGSVPPCFRPRSAESKQWSDVMSESTEAPEESDCESEVTQGSDSSPKSAAAASLSCSDADASPKGSTALRLSAQRYDPRAAAVAGVLTVLTTLLQSIPSASYEQEWSGKSVRHIMTMSPSGLRQAERVLLGAQQALLSAAFNSENVYVLGHARQPFWELPLGRQGFSCQLCVVDNYICMDSVDFGRCNRWCPNTLCRRRHPVADQLTEVVVELRGMA